MPFLGDMLVSWRVCVFFCHVKSISMTRENADEQAAKVGTSSSNSNSLHACARKYRKGRMAALEKNTLPNIPFLLGLGLFSGAEKQLQGGYQISAHNQQISL